MPALAAVLRPAAALTTATALCVLCLCAAAPIAAISLKFLAETSKEQPLSDAARAAVLAAALVALRRRSNALDAALHLARKQFPDLLAAPSEWWPMLV